MTLIIAIVLCFYLGLYIISINSISKNNLIYFFYLFYFCFSVNSSYYQNNYIDQSESSTINYSNCFDSKPSHTIEQLQMLLQNKTSESFEQFQIDYSVNETVKYSLSSINHDNSHWSSSKIKSDTNVQNNNQTFTYNDSEKLLTMVQQLRN